MRDQRLRKTRPVADTRRSARALTAVASTALLMFLAGCGGGGGQDQAVKQAVTQFLSAVGRGDGAAACKHVTPAGQRALANQIAAATKSTRTVSCQLIITEIGKLLPADVKTGLQNARISKVTVSGDTASVRDQDIHAAKGNLQPFLQGGPSTKLQRVGGVWMVTG